MTRGAVLGHSMGAIGVILAAAAEPRIAAVVATSAPADPWRLTRQTFRLARLPFPDAIAWPLAWLTTRVYLRPRGHRVADISATDALRDRGARPAGPRHRRRRRAGRPPRAAGPDRTTAGGPIERLVIDGGLHSWLYEYPVYRAAIAQFLTESLGGPGDGRRDRQAREPEGLAREAVRVGRRRDRDDGVDVRVLGRRQQ